MKCKKCGANLRENGMFCSNCGERIQNFQTQLDEKASYEDMAKRFEEIYNKLYNENICALEEIRKKYKKIEHIFLAIVIISISLFLILFALKIVALVVYAVSIYVGGIAVLCCVWSSTKYNKKYLKPYKSEVLSKFVNLVNGDLIYVLKNNKQYEKCEADYVESQFRYGRFFLDDYVISNTDTNSIKLGNIRVDIDRIYCNPSELAPLYAFGKRKI